MKQWVQMKWRGLMAAGVVLGCAVAGVALPDRSEEIPQKNPISEGRFDMERYVDLVLSFQQEMFPTIESMVDAYSWDQIEFLPIAPPSEELMLHVGGGRSRQIDPEKLPIWFVENLVPVGRMVSGRGYMAYPIWIEEDPITQDRLVFAADGRLLACVAPPNDYDPNWFVNERYGSELSFKTDAYSKWLRGIFSPARIVGHFDLVTEEAAMVIAASRATFIEPEGGGMTMAMGGGGAVTSLCFTAIESVGSSSNQQIQISMAWPTNALESISLVSCHDLVDPDWSLVLTTNVLGTTACVHTEPMADDVTFFNVFNTDGDSDGDGIEDYLELINGQDRFDPDDADEDPDGDGFSNLEEHLNTPIATDPNDPTNHPAGALYVAVAGSDTTGSGNYSAPYASIETGMTNALAGNRVVILPGVYSNAPNRALSFAGKAITVTGLQGERGNTIVDCGGVTNAFSFTNGETGSSVLARLRIINGSSENGGGIYCLNAAPMLDFCRIEDCEASNNGGGIYASGGACLMTNCTVRDCKADNGHGGGIYAIGGVMVSDCEVEDNSANRGGGIYALNSTVRGCKINGNEAEDRSGSNGRGGGIYADGGLVENCEIWKNKSEQRGGGIYCDNSIVRNCYVRDNFAFIRGGGVFLTGTGQVVNCTIVRNVSHEYGGGVYGNSTDATVQNSIVYYNDAAVRPNVYNNWKDGNPTTYTSCCITPDPGGAGNTTNALLLAGIQNPHLLAASPCRDAGSNSLAAGTDIDGETRIDNTTVDIGCDEYVATHITGDLDLEIDRPHGEDAVVGTPLLFQADLDGKAERFEWHIDTGAGMLHITNATEIAYEWSTPGTYDVVLWAINASGTTAETDTVHVASSHTAYVSPSGLHTEPFDSWETASTNISEAIDAVYAGGTVLVADGIYTNFSGELELEKELLLQSVNGAATTTIVGDHFGGTSNRCITISHPNAVLQGFTLRGGAQMKGNKRGGGIYLENGGTVNDCVVVDNLADRDGGGIFIWRSGLVDGCTVSGNTAHSDGGGIRLDYGGTIDACIVTNNNAASRGGGIHLHRKGVVRNCPEISGNQSGDDGGGIGLTHAWSNAIIEYCVVSNNLAGVDGGGIYMSGEKDNTSGDGTSHGKALVHDCLIINNTSVNDGGGIKISGTGGGTLVNGTICANTAERGDGIRAGTNGEIFNSIIWGNGNEESGKGVYQWCCCDELTAGSDGNIITNPNFVNAGANNYHIQSGSPCEDAGSNTHVQGSLDLDGTNRIINVTVDMGAYEVQ